MPMTMKEAWRSMKNWLSGDHGSSSHRSGLADSSSLSRGLFDQLPVDILLKILRLLEPRDAVRLSFACKACKTVANDYGLWKFYLQYWSVPWVFVFFAETKLRHPFGTLATETGELSIMRTIGQREQVPRSLVIDGDENDSGYCKYGWSNGSSFTSCTSLPEFGDVETPLYSRLQQFFGAISPDTESAKASIPQLETVINSVLFDMHVLSISFLSFLLFLQGFPTWSCDYYISYVLGDLYAVFNLYAARQTSGVVVNIGKRVTSIVPIGVEVVGIGALKLMSFSKEHFRTGEILFQPRLAGMSGRGLHQAVALCIECCHTAEQTGDGSWFKTVVLSGGSTCWLKGLQERLKNELHELLSPSIFNGIRIIHPIPSAGFGAKLVSNVSTFPGPWCETKKQLRRRSILKLGW